jgi:hypothetical protein
MHMWIAWGFIFILCCFVISLCKSHEELLSRIQRLERMFLDNKKEIIHLSRDLSKYVSMKKVYYK